MFAWRGKVGPVRPRTKASNASAKGIECAGIEGLEDSGPGYLRSEVKNLKIPANLIELAR